jgi:hypothetical protein
MSLPDVLLALDKFSSALIGLSKGNFLFFTLNLTWNRNEVADMPFGLNLLNIRPAG